jgi:dTDP-4-dehydrorhamnose 3,5-epimerase
MKLIPTALPDVLIFEPVVFSDDRGFFIESFNAELFEQSTGLKRNFVRDNHSRSQCGVLRGLHYQLDRPEGKVIRVISGRIFDVVVDLRKKSPTFGHSVGVELSAENSWVMWIPEGFAHGFLVLSESADVVYKSTDYYHPASEHTLLWSDPSLKIDWPLHELRRELLLSKKDQAGLPLDQIDIFS